MGVESPYQKPLLKRGIALGVQIGVATSLLLWGVIVLVGLFSKESITPNEQASPYVLTAVLVLATMALSLLPGSIGGATNVCVLSWLASTDKLTKTTSVVSGLVTGFLIGLATILGIFLISGTRMYPFAEFSQFVLLVAFVVAFAGGWHGWKVGRWLLDAQ
jgi:hypothetical protein